jgi:small subunit ribosomal protein S16
MAVHIRLQRFGAKRRPYYRIVAADHRARRDGRPMVDDDKVKLKDDRLQHWLSVGARPTTTVASLIRMRSRAAVAAEEKATN